jgi:beta-1,4-N-acetylglucosaminyltransferase
VIFVAVGTTDFDDLIREMDEVALTLSEEIVMQIGNGQYIPKNCQYFRFSPSLEPYYSQASIVVSHGGLGIVMEVLERGNKLIGVENVTCHGEHQRDLLSALAEGGYLIWCQDLNTISGALACARRYTFKRYVAPGCEIHTMIKDFLQVGETNKHHPRKDRHGKT